jgi:ketosteroid isomerase-like protein
MTDLKSIVEELYECFAAGDLDGMLRHTEPDVVLTQDERLPWGGRHVGRDGVAEFGLKLATTVDTTVVPVQLFEAGDTVIQVGRSRGAVRANGATYDIPECHVWTFRGDKVAAVAMFIESDSILELLAR